MFQLLRLPLFTETRRMHIWNLVTEHAMAVELSRDCTGRHAKSGAKEGVLPQLGQKLLEVARETAVYREASHNCRLAVLFFQHAAPPPRCTNFNGSMRTKNASPTLQFVRRPFRLLRRQPGVRGLPPAPPKPPWLSVGAQHAAGVGCPGGDGRMGRHRLGIPPTTAKRPPRRGGAATEPQHRCGGGDSGSLTASCRRPRTQPLPVL